MIQLQTEEQEENDQESDGEEAGNANMHEDEDDINYIMHSVFGDTDSDS